MLRLDDSDQMVWQRYTRRTGWTTERQIDISMFRLQSHRQLSNEYGILTECTNDRRNSGPVTLCVNLVKGQVTYSMQGLFVQSANVLAWFQTSVQSKMKITYLLINTESICVSRLR